MIRVALIITGTFAMMEGHYHIFMVCFGTAFYISMFRLMKSVEDNNWIMAMSTFVLVVATYEVFPSYLVLLTTRLT